jgi:hypothetical protein
VAEYICLPQNGKRKKKRDKKFYIYSVYGSKALLALTELSCV